MKTEAKNLAKYKILRDFFVFELRVITHALRETVLRFEYKFETCAKRFWASNINLRLARKGNHIWKQVMLIE